MRRRHSLPAALLVSLAVLAGCGNGSDEPSATASASASPTADSSSGSPSVSPTPSPSSRPPAFPRSKIHAKLMHKTALASSTADTPAEKAVVDAWMGYWRAATDTYYYSPKPVRRDLARFSQGTARASVENHLEDLTKARNRGVGWARDHVTSVKVTGDRATVRDCTENFTFDVDEEGNTLTKPVPWYDATGVLEKVDGRWVVTEASSRNLRQSCLS